MKLIFQAMVGGPGFGRNGGSFNTHGAFMPSLLLEMPEGQWGAGDVIWRLPDVTASAGFKHLQLVLAG